VREGWVHVTLTFAVPWKNRGGAITSMRHVAEALQGDLLAVVVEPADLELTEAAEVALSKASHPSSQPARHLIVVTES
jgi:hypothetical protein